MTEKNDDNHDLPFDPCLIDWFGENEQALKLFEQEWHLLLEEFPTDEDCIEGLYEALIADDPPTCQCGCRSFDRKYGARKGKCKKCRKLKHFFADFEFIKGFRKPRLYLFVLRLLQKGLRFSKNHLAETTDVSYSSVWSLITKLALAMLLSYQSSEELGQEISDSEDYLELFLRRSSATPAKQKPAAEQKAFADKAGAEGKEQSSSNSAAEGTTEKKPADSASAPESQKQNVEDLTPLELAVFELIGTEAVSFELLYDLLVEKIEVSVGQVVSTITILELKGLINVLAGDRYVRRKAAELKTKIILQTMTLQTSIDLKQSAIDYIRATYNGISRKYLQLYLADFCRVINYRAGKVILKFGDLIRAAADVAREEVLAFESPLEVAIFI